MVEIIDDRVTKVEDKYVATCTCGKQSAFSAKANALRMLEKGSCKSCKKDYRNVESDVDIYQNDEGKWCSKCSGCGVEQAYTRKDHAKQSTLSDWQCKPCTAKSKGFSNNRPVGAKVRLFNKFRKSAIDRGIEWELTVEDMFENYSNECSLSGWAIDIEKDVTASLDRIDSDKGYVRDNIQWVHKLVNMCKGKYDQSLFIDMCKAVANKSSAAGN